MTAGRLRRYFSGNLWGRICVAVCGALIRGDVDAFAAIHIRRSLKYPLLLISGIACILVCYIGLGRHVEMIMIGNIMLLIPGVLMTELVQGIFISGDMISGLLHFSEAMITAVCGGQVYHV